MGIRGIDRKKCTRCGQCVVYCPQDVLRRDLEGKPVIAYLEDCQSCFLCEKYCKAGAISVTAVRERRAVLPW